MDIYQVELPGTLTLDQQSKAIEGEEAQGRRFLDATLWVNTKNKASNRATFEILYDEPTSPLGKPVLKLTLADADTAVWTGQLIVKGSAKAAVHLVREPLEDF